MRIQSSLVLNPGASLECTFTNTPRLVFLIIDEDSVDNGLPPNFFDDLDTNDDKAEIGLRDQLRFFAANTGTTIELFTGEVGDEAWFAPTTTPTSWDDAGPNDGLRNFVGILDATATPTTFIPSDGLGRGSDPEELLDKIDDVIPLRAEGLQLLEGKTVCAVVYDSDTSINYNKFVLDGNLQGANLGTIAFKVTSVTDLTGFSSSSLPKVELVILDVFDVCGGTLDTLTEVPIPPTSSEPFDVSTKDFDNEGYL